MDRRYLPLLDFSDPIVSYSRFEECASCRKDRIEAVSRNSIPVNIGFFVIEMAVSFSFNVHGGCG